MDSVPVFVGLDYHQRLVQVCIMDRQGTVLANKRVANDLSEIAGVVGQYGSVVRCAIESCGGAADLAEELITKEGWSVDLAHTGYVNRMKQSPDKSDFTDARMLADLERVGYLPRVWLAPHYIRDLRRLVRYRQQLIDERRSTRLRIRALLREQRLRCSFANPWTEAWLEWLRKTDQLSEQSRWVANRHLDHIATLSQDITQAETHLKEVTREDAVVKRLLEYAGIGWATAWMLRAEIGRFDRFRSGKQLSRFCGLSPRNASSGDRQADAGLVKAANRQLRATLIEAAHRLARYDPRWTEFGTKLRRRGKPGSVAAAAVANRWIRWLFNQMNLEKQMAV